MYLNVFNGCLVVALVASLVDQVRAQSLNLGKLHWCDTLCLCHDETQENLHCFEERDLFSLVGVEERQLIKLARAGFQMKERLTWCTETCLCHKSGKKEFSCAGQDALGDFIAEKAPALVPYLEVEVVEEEEWEEEEKKEKKDRHERKRNRKHRRNRKKNHHDRKNATETTEEVVSEPLTTPIPLTVEAATEPERRVLSAHIFPQHSTGGDMPSQPPTKGPDPPTLEVPLEQKTVAGEVSNDLYELREAVERIRSSVDLNQHILWATIIVAGVAMIGVLILAIYSCCMRRSSKTITKGQRNASLHQDGNNLTKVNLDEAW